MILVDALADLRDAYPRSEFGDATILLYARQLEGWDPEAVADAVDRLIATSKFLPSVSEIKYAIADRALNLPTPEEAWLIAERGVLREAAEPVRIAAAHVGGRWAILHSDNIDTVRAQFRRAYESARAQALADFVRPRAALPGLAPPALLGPTMSALPESERYKPRPVMMRLMHRMAGHAPEPPTEEEKRDAIEILREGPINGIEDPLYQEAERIMRDSDPGNL
jgi:hypothetical protein